MCGKEFETKIHNRATCPECAKAIFNRINSTDKTAVCLVCGKIINEKPKRRRRYCSNSCKNIAHYIAFFDNLGDEPQIIEKGERFCQGVLIPAYNISIKEVSTLQETQRGDGGFGSTGK